MMKIKILLITIFVGIFLFQSISFALPSITVIAEKNFDRLFIGTAGTWNVFVTCGNESSSTTFQVKKFKLEIVKPTGKDDDYLMIPKLRPGLRQF